MLSMYAHEVSITAKMTVNEGPQRVVDPEASLRAELTGAIAAAQADLDNAIAELARSGADSSALTNQIQVLQQLQRTVGSANLGSLLALRGEVAATASNAQNLAYQAISSAAGAAAQTNLSPAERARTNIEALLRDLFEKRVLDPYLQFNSPEEEEAYRKRERERKEEIDRAMALGTPEGWRRATELAQEQLCDAGAHGADRSPHFPGMVQRLDAAIADLNSRVPEKSAANLGVKPEQNGARPVADDGLGDILAAFKAAGVTTPATQASDAGHGVTLAAAPASNGISTVRQG